MSARMEIGVELGRYFKVKCHVTHAISLELAIMIYILGNLTGEKRLQHIVRGSPSPNELARAATASPRRFWMHPPPRQSLHAELLRDSLNSVFNPLFR